MYTLEVDEDKETGQRTSTILHEDERIIVHDGIFHADEVFAIALMLETLGPMPIKRTREVTKEELADPNVWVLDQYGKLEPNLRNFDHHQDKNIESTNVLVLHYLRDMNMIPRELFAVLEAPFKSISLYDRNGNSEFNGFQVNEFFKSLNNIGEGGFDVALSMARIWIRGMKGLLVKKEESVELWKRGEVLMPNVRLCHSFPIFWKSYDEERILIVPFQGIWQVHSADTVHFPIQHTPKEKFLHINKFIAGYHTKADAIEAATIASRNQGTII